MNFCTSLFISIFSFPEYFLQISDDFLCHAKLFRLILLILLPMLLDSHRKIKLSRRNFRGYRLMFAFTTYDSSSIIYVFISLDLDFVSYFSILVLIASFLSLLL